MPKVCRCRLFTRDKVRKGTVMRKAYALWLPLTYWFSPLGFCSDSRLSSSRETCCSPSNLVLAVDFCGRNGYP